MISVTMKPAQRPGRRKFLANASALSAAPVLCPRYAPAAEPPPETTKIRLTTAPVLCTVPARLAEEMLLLEGFQDIEYVASPTEDGLKLIASNRADFAQWDVPGVITKLDAGDPILVLAGLHTGCQELFANERVRTPRDLKGKRIAVSAIGNGDHIFISSVLGYVGIDPHKEVTWVQGSDLRGSTQLFMAGEADAFMAFAPEPLELRRKKIGHVIVNLLDDKPWSQYLCCIVAGNRDFVRRNPVAAKRIVRAILKATDVCANEPERAARYMVDRGQRTRPAVAVTSFDDALEVVRSLPYRRWRDVHPEDTLRFYALRLYEAGMVKSTPQKLIAQGTDWRILDELKRELKA